MWGAIASGVGSLLGGLFGGGDDSAAEASKQAATDQGIKSAVQGSNPAPAGAGSPTSVSGSQSGKLLQDAFQDGVSSVVSGGISKLGSKILGTDAAGQGKATRDYLANAFPELTPWERAGAGGTMSGSADAGFQQQVKLQEKELDNQVKLKQMDNETQLKIAGINSSVSMRNVDEQLAPVLARLPSEIRRIDAEIEGIYSRKGLTDEQQKHEVQKLENSKADLLRILYGNSGLGRMSLDAVNAARGLDEFLVDYNPQWKSDSLKGVGSVFTGNSTGRKPFADNDAINRGDTFLGQFFGK